MAELALTDLELLDAWGNWKNIPVIDNFYGSAHNVLSIAFKKEFVTECGYWIDILGKGNDFIIFKQWYFTKKSKIKSNYTKYLTTSNFLQCLAQVKEVTSEQLVNNWIIQDVMEENIPAEYTNTLNKWLKTNIYSKVNKSLVSSESQFLQLQAQRKLKAPWG